MIVEAVLQASPRKSILTACLGQGRSKTESPVLARGTMWGRGEKKAEGTTFLLYGNGITGRVSSLLA